MKFVLLSRRFFLLFLPLAAFAAFLAIDRYADDTKAATGNEDAFALTSLNPGQTLRFSTAASGNFRGGVRVTARFNIYSLGGPDTFEGSVCPAGAVAACTNNLRYVRTESCTFIISSRNAATCDFTAVEANTFVNASLTVDSSNPRARVLPSLELRENNRTVFIHPGITKGFNPQPDPPLN